METITGMRIVARNNYSLQREQFIITHSASFDVSGPTRAEIAIELDEAVDEAVERRGYSGFGAGARMEIVFNGDDPDDEDIAGEEIESLEHSLVKNLPLGNRALLHRHIYSQRKSSVWDGHNHRPGCIYHAEQVVAAMESETARA